MPQIGMSDLITALPQPAIFIDADYMVECANAAAQALFETRLVGHHYTSVFRQPDIVSAIEQAFRERTQTQADFTRSNGVSDQRFQVDLSYLAAGVLVMITDHSAQDDLQILRRDFVANVSHELRTPLASLMGFIETLRGPARDDAQARARFLDIMEREATRMSKLVADLLSLSKVQATGRTRPTGQVDMTALVHETLGDMQPIISNIDVRVEFTPPAGNMNVTGDHDQLRQVLGNLIENAIRYGGENGTVKVTLDGPHRYRKLRKDCVALHVADAGPGIADHHLARLTERFYRVDSHRSRSHGGTGLGLAIVKHVVNRHRGDLKIKSTPGQGSVFSVFLPIAK